MRILLCQLRNHGDIIRTFPLIDAIKKWHPDCYIGYTCYAEMVDTCKLSDNIDVIIPQPRFAPVIDIQGGTRVLDCEIFTQSVERVKQYKFDIYIDLHGVFQSAVFGAMCNISHRLGRSNETAKDGAPLFYTDVCQINSKKINRMARHFSVINKILPEIVPNKKTLSTCHETISFFPGSSKMGILKRWKVENYVEAAKLLAEKYDVQFVLGPEENELQEYLNNKTNIKIVVQDSWQGILNEIVNSKVVIGNDGAYLHMAIWKGIPTIMICGPTSAEINGVWEYGSGKTLSATEICHCKDVWSGICAYEHKCMESISVESVIEAVREYL